MQMQQDRMLNSSYVMKQIILQRHHSNSSAIDTLDTSAFTQ
jgi:hypothetical protein